MSFTIGVTGTGGGVGQSILKSLANTDYKVVAMDGELLGTGLYAASTSYLIPFANNAELIPTLLEICKKEKIDLLFPGLDAELEILSRNSDRFKSIGTTVVVSSYDVISMSDNKQLMFDRLKNSGVNIPFTFPLEMLTKEQITYPVIIKQMKGGARSKNVFCVNSTRELNALNIKIASKTKNFVVQEYIEGDEYTCGTINLNGSCQGVIVMRRILRDGDTYKCFTVKNSIIEESVKKLMNLTKPFGACNVQLRLRGEVPFIFEMNARCSGTTAARALSGFNEPKMIADYLLLGIEPQYEIKEQTILRYWQELVIDNNEVSDLEKTGKLALKKHYSL